MEGGVEEAYETKIVEIHQELSMKSKDGIILPSKDYRLALERFGYTLHETIGEGAYAKVKRAYCKKKNENLAVKIIQKSKIPKEAKEKFLPREIALLQKLRHTSLIVLHEVYESRSNMYLVMEYLPNGDLLDYVNKVGSLSEADGRRVFHQLLDVVSYLHGQYVYHRDIKLDNILLDDQYNIRLTDFGFARLNPYRDLMETFCGSYAYAAPEILDGEMYDGGRTDIWSCGVCLYGMLNGKLPFNDTDVDILRSSMEKKLKFYKQVSKDCRELIRQILDTSARRRPSIPAIRKSVWMCKPLVNKAEQSMSVLSVKAVTSRVPHMGLNPTAEHGFSCGQNSKPLKTNMVTDILRSVAVNHSTGTSSINLKDVLPAHKASSTGMLLGVMGPAGRRINGQLNGPAETSRALSPGKATFQSLAPISENGTTGTANAGGDTAKKPGLGGGMARFKKAANALNRFKMAVRVVTAMRRFKRGPITTILTIPQEQAMAKIINVRENQTVQEVKEMRFTPSGKVASVLGSTRRHESEVKQETADAADAERKKKEDKLKMWGDTFAHLVPDT
ncbi:LOW QUALITY PROTEIN: testis-specific serine/threonine-protein kinase 1-like [Haliotis rubra]|uniref:LOW QUALITY PROTEIN: testis-specific serine/threonine-protein kinase 1-like n=1 Tax=Haliotis rubra TaxID=36100 RepID=UPI001EE598A8|nr:LOW QUALITY PROTEIN: testis-specific serine/threonine-protein kinase 1-like [Haliotis rubra]